MPRLACLPPRLQTLGPRLSAPPKVADGFYLSPQWREARALCIALRGSSCAKCGRKPRRVFVDHIVELKDGGAPFDQTNLEPLCGSCHSAKSDRARAERMRSAA